VSIRYFIVCLFSTNDNRSSQQCVRHLIHVFMARAHHIGHGCNVLRITFDATGTLFRPKASIGSIYLRHYNAVIGSSFSESSEEIIAANFRKAFQKHIQLSPNFGRTDRHGRSSAHEWWSNVIFDSFPPEMQAQLHENPRQTMELLQTLYEYYAQGNAWEVTYIALFYDISYS
jgi:hypothetical protein